MMSPVPIEDQAKLLDEVLNVVKVQAHLMKKCLVSVSPLFSSFFFSREIQQVECLTAKFVNRKITSSWMA